MVLVVLIIPPVIMVDTRLKNPEIVPQITMVENEDLLKKLQDGKKICGKNIREVFRQNIFYVKSMTNFVFHEIGLMAVQITVQIIITEAMDLAELTENVLGIKNVVQITTGREFANIPQTTDDENIFSVKLKYKNYLSENLRTFSLTLILQKQSYGILKLKDTQRD